MKRQRNMAPTQNSTLNSQDQVSWRVDSFWIESSLFLAIAKSEKGKTVLCEFMCSRMKVLKLKELIFDNVLHTYFERACLNLSRNAAGLLEAN